MKQLFLDGLWLGICITIIIFPKKGIAPTYPKIQWLRFDDDPSPRKLAKTATACHLAVMSYPKLRDRTYHKFSMSQCQIISKDGSWTAGLEHWYSVVKKWMMSIQNQSNGKRQPDCHAESEVRAGGRWGWKRGWWPVSWQLSWEIPLDPCLYTWFGRQYSTFQSKNYWRTFRGNSQYLGWRTNGFPYISIGFLYVFFPETKPFQTPIPPFFLVLLSRWGKALPLKVGSVFGAPRRMSLAVKTRFNSWSQPTAW